MRFSQKRKTTKATRALKIEISGQAEKIWFVGFRNMQGGTIGPNLGVKHTISRHNPQ
jgi:hypothetical protein